MKNNAEKKSPTRQYFLCTANVAKEGSRTVSNSTLRAEASFFLDKSLDEDESIEIEEQQAQAEGSWLI